MFPHHICFCVICPISFEVNLVAYTRLGPKLPPARSGRPMLLDKLARQPCPFLFAHSSLDALFDFFSSRLKAAVDVISNGPRTARG
jgi:hypothetical protein